MIYKRKMILISCRDCKKSYMKREDTLSIWGGRCIPCAGNIKSEKMKGKIRGPFSLEHRKNLSKGQLGKKMPPWTEEQRRKAGESHRGSRAWNWKGGVMKNPQYVSFSKNKRNRIIKRLKIKSFSHSFEEWELLKKQYVYTCPCCKRSEPDIKLTIDHIVPLGKGGTDLIENIQPLCLKCNLQKHSKIIKFPILYFNLQPT